MNLNGKIAIVTGAANEQGIGYAIAKKFLEYGAIVTITDVNPHIQEAADRLQAITGRPITGIQLDVTHFNAMSEAISSIRDQYGRIDIVVNNAAVNIPGDSIEASLDEWDLHYNVNVKSQFIMSKLVTPIMRQQRYGKIVNIASVNSYIAEKQLYAYIGTKGAVRQQTMADALDNAPYGININCIGPGLVNTGFNDPHHDKVDGGRDEVMKHITEINPSGRAVEAEEIANMALFLASDLASGCVGGYYPVDGGYSIK
ncbi:SDR family NAD(P)-dependent oxidoreductase [Cohnella mopanensis]|uniref:SDR family NAD(P)-dependent oxidoreductase n=1 Tax=Cohnella mopanensis TaxID=2911966 RepID=UPI001EF7785D|nr:SDR family oxidoreductase [Cohnella mopanensis]